ncbi:Ubiquitin-conjugating enzyme/RWD-like protein [Pseudocohnilembus persalinus]|uniref:Ubiquitin-conjugating enzyme/RWD-like protein n=1 Tax=Pseudocohnilembus persalinus TaxID=266149 RepID=A0A0V0QFT9_PSEPJ|nr:Ubiquitin-conjugating enzyme/RWD-like protein [Pseudocohnilembus persalinus]|eukprot:KRX01078.1 Ubiquitin-conjugating enzyme/RWD-like protein [Pseudocohnilembus persalinus]
MEQTLQARQTRLQKELKITQNKLRKNPNPHIILLQPIISQNGVNLDFWQFKFEGKKGSPFEGGYYDVIFKFPYNYPCKPPKAQFLHKFKHMHVYVQGDVCLPLIAENNWQHNLSIYEIALNIFNMIHAPPIPRNKANQKMQEIFNISEEDYYDTLRLQAQKFSQYKDFVYQIQ